MLPLVLKNWSVDERAHLEKSRIEILRNGSRFGNFSSVCRVIFSVHHYFGAYFGALVGVKNVPKWACWKACSVYFLTPLKFLNLVLIFSSKSSFSQDCYMCVKKGAERPFLGVFWPFEDSYLAKISFPGTSSRDFPRWIQKCKPFLIWSSRILASRRWRKTLCFAQKIFMWPKIPQIPWNFGWRFSMECYDVRRKPQPRFKADLALLPPYPGPCTHISCPIMISHVSQQGKVLIGLFQ